jgi:hypothetical protein
VKSPIPGRNDLERQFRNNLHTVLRTLEETIDELLENFWEEPLRRHSLEMANALLESCKSFGYLELASVSRAMTSLLALPMEDVCTLQGALTEKLRELMGLMKEMAKLLVA